VKHITIFIPTDFFLYIMKRCISALQQTNAYYTTLQVLNWEMLFLVFIN